MSGNVFLVLCDDDGDAIIGAYDSIEKCRTRIRSHAIEWYTVVHGAPPDNDEELEEWTDGCGYSVLELLEGDVEGNPKPNEDGWPDEWPPR